MIVIGDTCAISYICKINKIKELNKTYGKIVIPKEVEHELEKAPSIIKMSLLSADIETVEVKNFNKIENLHKGENEAICLYNELNADLFLTDDKDALNYCEQNNINIKRLDEVFKDMIDKGIDLSDINIKEVKDKYLIPDYAVNFLEVIYGHKVWW